MNYESINFLSLPHSVRTTEAKNQESHLYIKKGGFIDSIEGGIIYIDQVLSILSIEIKRMGIIEVKND